MIFNNKTVVITGASEGVGAATARMFADAGANLMLVARTKKNLERVAEELRDKTRVEIFAMDVADAEACLNVFKKAEYEFGRVDILVNNAGLHERGPVEDVSPNDLGNMIDVNLRAPVMLTRIALPFLRDAGSGAVVNVGSLAGRTPVPDSAGYAASKAGLRSFTYALAEELRDTDIKIAIVSPGPIDTGFIMADIDATTDLTFSQPLSDRGSGGTSRAGYLRQPSGGANHAFVEPRHDDAGLSVSWTAAGAAAAHAPQGCARQSEAKGR